jgi:hypothetical protein
MPIPRTPWSMRCWRSVQLLDFDLCGNLIHASHPIRTTFTGQWFASGFLQPPPHDDALAIGCTLPTAGRVRDFHPLERAPAGRTTKEGPWAYFCPWVLLCFRLYFFHSPLFRMFVYSGALNNVFKTTPTNF